MVYLYIFVPLIFIGLFIWNTVRSSKRIKKVKIYSKNPDIGKVVLWADLEAIDGKKTDYTYSYWKSVRDKISNKNTDVIVLLLKAGEYNFTASSKSDSKFKSIAIKGIIQPGFTYQLGCNNDEIYFVKESEPDRYNL